MLTILFFLAIVVVLHPMNLKMLKYTVNYCEENIWHLSQHPQLVGFSKKVLIISNGSKNCPFYAQKSANGNLPVWWDYHVVLLASKNGESFIYDFDSTLPFPSPITHYLNHTFPNADIWLSKDLPVFKAIEAEFYIENFYSDRSHMMDPLGNWIFTPPIWPTITEGGNLKLHDLMDFTEMCQEQLIPLEEMQMISNDLQSSFCNI
jgi:protein N-terminal glutamine amidohydrolase